MNYILQALYKKEIAFILERVADYEKRLAHGWNLRLEEVGTAPCGGHREKSRGCRLAMVFHYFGIAAGASLPKV